MARKKKGPGALLGEPGDRVLFVRCLNCDNLWFPNASRWTSDGNSKGKVLRCPVCRHYNRIPPSMVTFLIKQSKKIPETGFMSIKEKEEYLKTKKKK